MRRIAVGVGVVAGGLVTLIGGYLAYVWNAPLPTYPVEAPELTVEVTPARVERGKKLASLLCANCHFDAETGALSGRQAPYPKSLGTFYSRNLTSGPPEGLRTWSDGELYFYLRTGVGPDGRVRLMGPELLMADEDVLSIIAFLRSDDPWVRPIDNALPAPVLTLAGKLVVREVLKPPVFPRPPIPLPDPADPVAQGRYVVQAAANCWVCHSGESFSDLETEHPEQTPNYLGGREDESADGTVMWTQNLTFGEETGLGSWTLEEFDRSVRQGFSRDGRPLRPPMPLFAELTDAELAGVWAYLQTVPKLDTPRGLPRPEAPQVAGLSPGQAAYESYGCPACHGADGNGACDLRGAHEKYPDDAALEAYIRNPAAFVSPPKMPAWNDVVADADWAPLVAYVRQLGRH